MNHGFGWLFKTIQSSIQFGIRGERTEGPAKGSKRTENRETRRPARSSQRSAGSAVPGADHHRASVLRQHRAATTTAPSSTVRFPAPGCSDNTARRRQRLHRGVGRSRRPRAPRRRLTRGSPRRRAPTTTTAARSARFHATTTAPTNTALFHSLFPFFPVGFFFLFSLIHSPWI